MPQAVGDPGELRRFASSLKRFTADLHRAGVDHDDFHAGNILLQGAEQRVVDTALNDDADICVLRSLELFVQSGINNVLPRRWNALVELQLFLRKGDGWMREFCVIELGRIG